MDSPSGNEMVASVGRLVGAMEAAAAIAVLLGERAGALADLRTVRAGGHLWGEDELLDLLLTAGLRDPQHLELGPGVPGRLTAARR